eukprot:CAMPEP_0174281714 /NCGR_PEP_ID=MMETSP0809-20121228/2112_1 /TAXON_ID=73025 ORGANISM="Eutreptiella gymnastica-like, Strain CCMP1594" /NCGR_SAMPLE_ID=MMETSP0809 /ASSEMBLY_ACC=CAM_ASM_000658 /LENGTH=138 /DNA_ID=CAMNT_0015375427 /DNA_START=70 /DNA_END=486 /DNA_ORIENTATION=-
MPKGTGIRQVPHRTSSTEFTFFNAQRGSRGLAMHDGIVQRRHDEQRPCGRRHFSLANTQLAMSKTWNGVPSKTSAPQERQKVMDKFKAYEAAPKINVPLSPEKARPKLDNHPLYSQQTQGLPSRRKGKEDICMKIGSW